MTLRFVEKNGKAKRRKDRETNARRHPEAFARPFVGRTSKGDGAQPQRTAAQAAILRDAACGGSSG
jgi:hypothetical protein